MTDTTTAQNVEQTRKPFAQSPGDQKVDFDHDDMRESHFRTLLKTLSWRIIATCTTITIAYLVFGNVQAALTVGGFEFFAKMVIYYFHERTWQLAPRGTVRKLIEKE